MSRKHSSIGLLALGTAALAGAAAALAWQQIRNSRQEELERMEEAILLDLDGDGEADVIMEDRDGDGIIDTVTTDTTMLDLTGGGDVDVVITGNPEVLQALRDSGVSIQEAPEDASAEA